MVIVEKYSSKEEAQIGHNNWVKRMISEPLPDRLEDCANSIFGKLAIIGGNNLDKERNK